MPTLTTRRVTGRRVVALLVMFGIGAGIGIAVVALSGRGGHKRVVVRHMVVTRGHDRATGRHAGHQAPHQNGTAVASTRPVVPSSAEASFGALAAQLGGQVGLAAAPLGSGRITTFGMLQEGHAWSTMKVPVLATLLGDLERRGSTLSSGQDSDATLALEQSDNTAAEALFSDLEQTHGGLVGASLAVQRTLRSAGDTRTTINTAPNDQGFTTWGQSIWSPTGEVLFYRALASGCLLDGADTDYVLRLMRSVIPSQRWGAGAAGYSSAVSLAFKAGWGPESGGAYVVRQTAIVGSRRHGYVISMIARPGDGSFGSGVSMITSLANWARRHLNLVTAPSLPC